MRKLSAYRTTGKNGGVREISLVSNGDGTLTLRPMGKHNVKLDLEMLKFLSSRRGISAIRRHLRRVKLHMKSFHEFEMQRTRPPAMEPVLNAPRPTSPPAEEELINIHVSTAPVSGLVVPGPVLPIPPLSCEDAGCPCEDQNSNP